MEGRCGYLHEEDTFFFVWFDCGQYQESNVDVTLVVTLRYTATGFDIQEILTLSAPLTPLQPWDTYSFFAPSHSLAARPIASSANPAPAGITRSVRSCNCCPYGYHIDLDFVRYCEALAHEKPSEEEQRRRDRRRSRKSMEFMLGFESLFGGDWQAESRVQGKLSEVCLPIRFISVYSIK